MTAEILATNPAWRTNAALIADVAALGWLDGLVLDATFGRGNFWTQWRPILDETEQVIGGATLPWSSGLVANDLHVEVTADWVADATALDARNLPAWCGTSYPDWEGGIYDAVVFDPPYKLNGQAGSVAMDSAYGVDAAATFAERLDLILWGSSECARVARPGGWLHIKAQNQICGGRYIDITRAIKDHLDAWADVELRAEWQLVVTPRPQPPGRRQLNPRNNTSTLLSFKVLG